MYIELLKYGKYKFFFIFAENVLFLYKKNHNFFLLFQLLLSNKPPSFCEWKKLYAQLTNQSQYAQRYISIGSFVSPHTYTLCIYAQPLCAFANCLHGNQVVHAGMRSRLSEHNTCRAIIFNDDTQNAMEANDSVDNSKFKRREWKN